MDRAVETAGGVLIALAATAALAAGAEEGLPPLAGTPSPPLKGGAINHTGPGRITAMVTWVVDGDTFHVAVEGGEVVRVRVLGVNSPEMADRMGPEAKEFTRAALEGKTVTLDIRGYDRWGRALAFVFYDDGGVEKSLGYELVLAGLAVVYSSKYALNDPEFTRYKEAQMAAMALRRGVWGREGVTVDEVESKR